MRFDLDGYPCTHFIQKNFRLLFVRKKDFLDDSVGWEYLDYHLGGHHRVYAFSRYGSYIPDLDPLSCCEPLEMEKVTLHNVDIG